MYGIGVDPHWRVTPFQNDSPMWVTRVRLPLNKKFQTFLKSTAKSLIFKYK